MTSYVFVIGFELSGIGKGTIASSLGLLLKAYGIRTSALKIDPYLNIDPGTISPHEHGEVYVLADGSECDLDLGNYERFLGVDLTRENSITTGQIYKEVIQREREGKYLGKTVQIVPHITDHIEERILRAANPVGNDDGKVGPPPEVLIVELGGTVGDMESEQYLYAISRFQVRTGAQVCVLGVGMLVNNNGEQKTKPLQHAVQELRRHFIAPDVLCVRCDMVLADFPIGLRQKIAQSCHMDENAIIVSGKVKSIYEVPQLLHGQKLTELVCRKLGLLWRGTLTPDFTSYQRILQHLERTQLQSPQLPVRRVAIIAKYSGVDTYLSILRALEHASFAQGIWMQYEFVDAERLESNDHNDRPELLLADFQCILVPGGFGSRGVEGKMRAIRFARQTRRPFLGICLGMQLFVIDHCRTVLGWHDANSTEFDPDTPKPVVRHLSAYGDTLVKQLHLGGTMKLGLHKTRVTPLTRAAVIYSGSSEVRERHRHRYEVSMVKDIEQATASLHPESQILFSGWWQPPDQSLNCIPDIVESADPHWWAVGCQFHPEFLSRNENPHPLFVAFLSAQVV